MAWCSALRRGTPARATLGGLEVRRKMPHGVSAGDLLVVNLELSNPRRRLGSWAVVVEEQISSEAGPGRGQSIRPSVFFGYVPPRASREGVYRAARGIVKLDRKVTDDEREFLTRLRASLELDEATIERIEAEGRTPWPSITPTVANT